MGVLKTGKGKVKAKDAAPSTGGKARNYGTIGEEPIETHRMDTPPKETTGAAKKKSRMARTISKCCKGITESINKAAGLRMW